MVSKFRPLLAATVDDSNIDQLKYPLLASPKLDGIRALVVDGVLVSRTLKPIRNKELQKLYGRSEWNGLDGELIDGPAAGVGVFRRTTSAVMGENNNSSDCRFYIFDNFLDSACPYMARFNCFASPVPITTLPPRTDILTHVQVFNLEELIAFEKRVLDNGFEGVMLRSPSGKYKYGRSTFKEGILLKLKRGQIQNGDAQIIGFSERMQNNNEATIDNLGLQKRGSSKEHLVGKGDLGALRVKDIDTGYEFSIGIGTGLNDALRSEIWDNQENYLGKIVRYEWFKYGNYDLPRFPKFVSFRDKEDIS